MATKTSNQTHIYSASGVYIASQPYDYNEWKVNPRKYYSEYQPGMIGTDTLYEFPIVEDGQIREMSIEEQLSSGLRVLGEGEKYDPISQTIIVVPKPDGMLKHVWNFETLEWEEGATQEELIADIGAKVYKWRDEIWAQGFDYHKSSDGTTHHQLLREKDSNKITETVQFMDKLKAAGVPVTPVQWQFSEEDIAPMSYEDMNELFMYGSAFTQAGYTVMATWRAKESVDLKTDTFEKFKSDMDSVFQSYLEHLSQVTF